MERPIRILYIEDNPLDRELVRDVLEKEHGGFHVTIAATRAEFETHLASGEFDAVLSDFNILGFEGMGVLDAVREKKLRLPVIIVTGTGSEEIAVEAMKRGASDYVIKSPRHIQRLPQTIHAALDKQHLLETHERAEEALKKSEERFRTSVETLLEGFAILSAVRDSHGQIIDFKYDYINETGCKMNQKPLEEHMGKTLLELLPTHKEIGLFNEYVRVVETGLSLAKEFLIYETVYGSGERLRQAFDVRITRLGDGFVTTWQDITDKKKGEELLRQSEERLRLLIENSKDVVIMADLEGSAMYYNGPPEYGITAEEVLGKNPFSIFDPVIAARFMNQLKRVIKDGEALTFENVIPLNGESFWFLNQMYPIRDEKGRMIAVGVIARNITERKRAEDREQLAHEVLNLLNRWETTTNTIREILFLFKKKMGFEAVGIRLREGDDFPYFETNGFSEDFVQAERHLCAYDKEGKIARDGKGNPVLECMCGNILCGRTDAALPFFTAGGSFWTNSTTDLLASTTEEDRQSRTRNRCNGEGYESVALIPLRSGDEIIGLLQLNDRRRNQFTPEMIHFFEGVGASVGIALSRKRAEEEYKTILRTAMDGFWIVDIQGRFLEANDAYCRLIGYRRDEMLTMRISDVEAVETPGETAQRIKKIMEVGGDRFETRHRCKDGRIVDVEISVNYIDAGGGRLFVFARDITERKRAEEALRRKSGEQALLLDNIQIQIWYLTDKETYGAVNKARADFFGKKKEEIENKKVCDVLGKDEAEICLSGYVEVFEKRKQIHTEEWIMNAKGEKRLLSIIKTPKLNENGDVGYVVCSAEDITERKRAEKERDQFFEEVRASHERLRNLSRRLVEVQEVERHDLVRKLHDEVGQSLTALSINLNIVYSQLPPETATKMATRIDDSLKLVEETVERIRDVMAELRPPVLDDYGVSAALHWYGKQFSERTGIITLLQVEELKPRLPLPAETALFRIAQEALTNVAKYSQAKNVTVRLEEFGESVHLSIADDGIGFDSEAHHQQEAKPEWGLINMRERAQAIGGQLSVETAPGKGTRIMVEVPRNR